MKPRHMIVKGLAAGGLMLTLASSGIPQPVTNLPLQFQPKIPKSALLKDLCRDCKTGPITVVGPTTRKPVKLQIDPHTGELFQVP